MKRSKCGRQGTKHEWARQVTCVPVKLNLLTEQKDKLTTLVSARRVSFPEPEILISVQLAAH